ncbi:MAG: YesL family protein [Pseudobutyrivibrio sp.]|uniref:YesL family protein n=1 Tax=Pseudobutyrivibrio sp. TaxID=2014367 RepID=UPI0025F22461|nr:DUF624 domain-containing protein [Pseudobutyrivibrio sp.]MBQ8490384.1 YesL family protein [Pseudobutyrivibrio sp.]
MRNLLNYDGPVLRFLTKVVYSVWLNILWFVCCIPVVTIGASTTALCYCTGKIARDEEGYITKAFFSSFKDGFLKSTIIGIIMTVLGVVLAVDAYVMYHLCFTSAFWTLVSAILVVACIAYIIVLLWVFPLNARFENTIINMFKNSIMLGMRFIFCTVIMAGIYVIMAYLIYYVCTPLIIFGVGTCALFSAMLMKNILIQCEEQSES